jgi:hypothetical protein
LTLGAVRPGARAIRLLAALLLALAMVGLAPATGGRDAFAAPDLTLVAATTYEVHPNEGRVAVTATVTATNHLADTQTRRYFFESGYLSVLPGTANFAVTAGSGSPSVAVSSRTESGTLLLIRFGTRLAAGASMTLTLTYDLLDPGGAPDRPVRISPSIVTFQAWASASDATPGSSVEVRIPEGYTTAIGRGPLTGPVASGGWQVYSSGPLATPLTFVADITADQPGEYVDGRRSTTIGDETAIVVIRAWPDDAAWRERVGDLVLGALPVLADDIGVAWPYDEPLTVTETLVRGNGFEGAFDPEAALVEIGYAASPTVILHEAAHAWFNGQLVGERWIAEAFASYYAERAAATMGVEIVSPGFDGEPDQGAFPLNAWLAPGEASPEQDAFGAAASLALAREIAAIVGDDVLREVWGAAAAGAPAYQPPDVDESDGADPPGSGQGAPELGAAPPDWRGLLDLLVAHADADQASALEGLWRRWVIRPPDAEALDARAAARDTYAAAVAQAAPWSLPRQVRDAMRAWQFPAAIQLSEEAGAVIHQRSAFVVAAAAEGLDPPPTLREAFEGGASLPEAAAEAATQLATLGAIGATRAARIVNPSVADTIGLIGADPEADFQAARAAFEAGDLDPALTLSLRAADAWEAAPAIGRGRIISAALLGLAVVLLAWLVWGRRRRRSATKVDHARPVDRVRR